MYCKHNAPLCANAATFATERLPLAIFLHAARRLLFAGCQATDGDGRVRFLFQDPNHEAAQAELTFDQGATVAATALFASQKFLRRKMSEAIENRNNGKKLWERTRM
jgi:hypothetical protein